MLLNRIGVASVGLIAVVVPLEIGDAWGWSPVDVVFLVWLMTPFLWLIAVLGRLGGAEQVVLTAGLAVATAAFETAVIRSDSSTAAIGLLFLPLYLFVALAAVVFLGRVWRALH
jgi:hypothetical protein